MPARATRKKRTRSKFANVRHPFQYEIELPDGSRKKRKAWALVTPAKKPVTLSLTEEHILKAIGQHGEGDSARCAGSVCVYDHKSSFPHQVVGYTDWWPTRVYIASKLDKYGLPSVAYVYEHQNKVDRLFDSEAGQQRLLKRVRKYGSISINLKPYRQRSEKDRDGRDRLPTGKRAAHLVGHSLRAARIASWKMSEPPTTTTP